MKIKNSGIKLFLFTLLLVLSSLILYGTNYYVQLMAEHSNNEFESFREKSIRASFTIQNHIDKEVESLFQMRDVYRLKGRNLTRYEFNMIARAIMSRTQGIQALEWIPHVQQKQRVMYEQQARDEGIEGFSFKAIYEDGAVKSSPEKSEYYPVYYVEPLSGNEKALGLDLSSSQPRIEALLKSLQVNSVVASEGIKLVQEGKDYNGILLFLPIGNLNNENQESFLIGVFKIKDMISSAFADSVHPDLIIHVYDLNDEDNLYPLASIVESEHNSTLPTIEELTDVNSLLSVSTIDIADRQWALVIKPVNPIQHKDSEYFAWLVSLLLLAVMLLVAMYLYSQIRHASKNREAHLQYQSLSEKLQAILNNTIDGIVTINHRGVIQSVNKAALDMFGYSSEEMIGNNVNMITPEPIKSEHDSYIKNYLDGEPPKVIGSGRDIEGVRKDGVKIPLRLGVSKAKVNDEVVFIGLLHDISERKNNERLKDEFISTVNHELRTPLTSILGSIQLISKVGSDQLDKNTKKLLKTSENNSRRIIRIVNDILDLQKINSGDMTFDFVDIDLVALSRKSMEECQPYAVQHGVTLDIVEPTEGIHVNADKLRIAQVITNFLSNAVKFSPENTQILVRIELTTESKSVVLSVEDEGPGISHEFQDKIFQPFTQAESHMTRKTSGTGLGLSISKSIIEKHNGRIGVKNRAEVGACFYFILPLSEQ